MVNLTRRLLAVLLWALARLLMVVVEKLDDAARKLGEWSARLHPPPTVILDEWSDDDD